MRLLATLLLTALVTPAVAQEQPTMDAAKLAWEKPPSIRDMARHYPRRAQLERVAKGSAKLHCTAAATGALACTVAEQSPEAYGFGEAALKVMGPARVRSTDGGDLAGRTFVYGVKFGNWAKEVRARSGVPAAGLAWVVAPSVEIASRAAKSERQVTAVDCRTLEAGALDCQIAPGGKTGPLDAGTLKGFGKARVKSVDGAPVEGRSFTYHLAVDGRAL